jgi:predicted RNA-binding protein with PIN domain
MFLIDGYNLLHAAFPDQATGGSRRHLVDLVVEFCRRGGYRARIVFDATGEMPRRQRRGEVEIRNVPRGSTADDEILEALASTDDRTAHTLVTNDRALAQEAGRRGVKVISCEEFSRFLDAHGPSEDPKAGWTLSSGEVDYWLKEFGLDDPPRPPAP